MAYVPKSRLKGRCFLGVELALLEASLSALPPTPRQLSVTCTPRCPEKMGKPDLGAAPGSIPAPAVGRPQPPGYKLQPRPRSGPFPVWDSVHDPWPACSWHQTVRSRCNGAGDFSIRDPPARSSLCCRCPCLRVPGGGTVVTVRPMGASTCLRLSHRPGPCPPLSPSLPRVRLSCNAVLGTGNVMLRTLPPASRAPNRLFKAMTTLSH